VCAGLFASLMPPGFLCRNWLKSRFHFSFAEYRGSGNDNFGCLRVMNDDLVRATFQFEGVGVGVLGEVLRFKGLGLWYGVEGLGLRV